jgi:hypothetical protein
LTEEPHAYRRLWASVIIQALIDATAQPKTAAARLDRDRAVAWITTSVGVTAQNFESVCYAAEFEPETVRTFFQKYEGPPLSVHQLAKLRDKNLKGA